MVKKEWEMCSKGLLLSKTRIRNEMNFKQGPKTFAISRDREWKVARTRIVSLLPDIPIEPPERTDLWATPEVGARALCQLIGKFHQSTFPPCGAISVTY